MDGALVQLANIIDASVYGKSHHNSKQRGVANGMLRDNSAQMRRGLRISTPSLSLSIGGGGFNNAVDNKFLPISISASRGRGTQCVARAMSPSFEKNIDQLIFTDHTSNRFTAKGIEVIKLAHKESRRMGHNYVGTQQILLGLIAQETGIAAKVLKSMGISLEDAHVEVEKITNERGNDGFVDVEVLRVLVCTPEEGRVLRHTLEEAGGNCIFPEHWLLGLLHEDECVATLVLENLGADANKIRTQVIQMSNGETTEAA